MCAGTVKHTSTLSFYESAVSGGPPKTVKACVLGKSISCLGAAHVSIFLYGHTAARFARIARHFANLAFVPYSFTPCRGRGMVRSADRKFKPPKRRQKASADAPNGAHLYRRTRKLALPMYTLIDIVPRPRLAHVVVCCIIKVVLRFGLITGIPQRWAACLADHLNRMSTIPTQSLATTETCRLSDNPLPSNTRIV